MALIKKYENRRLYDSEASRYVNLEDIANMVRSGADVRVVDAKTDADLTREILLQVLLAAPGGSDLLPVGMLRRVIRCTGDDPLNRLLRQHLTVALDMLHTQMDAAEGQLARMMPSARAPAPSQPTNVAPPPPVEAPSPSPAGAAAAGPSGRRAAESPHLSAPADELSALRARLQALEGRLGRGT